MLLSDALQELSTACDAFANVAQGAVFTRLSRQLTRLVRCEDALRSAVLRHEQLHSSQRARILTLERECEDLQQRNKRLQHRVQRERQEREEEKEWIAALWPDEVVRPTILRGYEPEPVVYVSQVEETAERERLQALVRRRAARDDVLHRLEVKEQWNRVVVPPSTSPDGEYNPGQVYYLNSHTQESVWEPPVAMFYEPPSEWDVQKMDWKESYGVEHFMKAAANSSEPDQETATVPTEVATKTSPHQNPTATRLPATSDSEDGDSDDDDGSDSSALSSSSPRTETAGSTARAAGKGNSQTTGDGGDDDTEDDEDEQPLDPLLLRDQLTQEQARAGELRRQLEQSQTQQRALALQLLNATRESFECEREEIAEQDKALKDEERKRRKAKQQEEAAAKAKAAAEEKKASKSVQPHFARDSVAKKDMTLSKDDELFEKELQEWVVLQRADRRYLVAPLSRDPRVRTHQQWDDEYIHMTHIDEKSMAIEQKEYDIIEKSASRHEEAASRSEELTAQCQDIRSRQIQVDEELKDLEQRIPELETETAQPTEPPPSEEDMERARERFLIPTDPSMEDVSSPRLSAGDSEDESGISIATVERDLAEEPRMTTEEVANIIRDEAELKRLKRCVELSKQWKQWEEREVLRLEQLAAAYDRFKTLELTQRHLVVELAMTEADAQFFSQMASREKELHDRLWKVQADAQVQRASFLVERSAREESVYQVMDEITQLEQRLEEARRLPRRATNPIEKVELIEESKQQAEKLQGEYEALQKRLEREFQARDRLIELENRFYDYSQQRLDEEMKLFTEKQGLWEQNFSLQEDIQRTRLKVEELYAALVNPATPRREIESKGATDDETMDALHSHEGDQPSVAPPSPDAVAADFAVASASFDEKLQRMESLRQYLLLCYDRECRWRSLASVALIKDVDTEEWMTSMQQERQDETLALLQRQHEAAVAKLRCEIKLQERAKALLYAQLQDRGLKIERLQREYQNCSDAVRVETEQIILGLKAALEQEEKKRQEEQTRAVAERERLMKEHDGLRVVLEQRIVALEDETDHQWHWLTAAKRELQAQRIANEELLMGYQALEQRRASETNDMRFRISSQIKKINNIEMWNLSLKIQSREAHRERLDMQREMKRLVEHHKAQQRILRLENWRHRVTAQAILTDVDLLFRFFAMGLGILAGATPESNDAIRLNGGIDVLAILARHSSQQDVREIASKALGLLAWNSNVTQRSLGWKAKRVWYDWQKAQSDRVLAILEARQMQFDDVAPENDTAMNWLAETAEHNGGKSESDVANVDRKTKKIHFLRTWNARDDIERPDVNTLNQEHIGLAPGVLQTLLDLCKLPASLTDDSRRPALRIQRNALRSLAIIVMNSRNTAIVGRMDGCIPLLVSLLEEQPENDPAQRADSHVLRHAILALGNLAFQNDWNQTQICAAGAVPILLAFCAAPHRDVDVLLASVQTLSNLSSQHLPTCERIFDNNGIAVLTRLCHSYQIHDAIDLDVFEEIQTCAAETISNVITTLDGHDPSFESGDRERQEADATHKDPTRQGLPNIQRDVAYAILAAQECIVDLPNAQRNPRGGGHSTVSPGVTTFVLMCAACHRDVALHGALVLGSIARHDEVRAAIGDAGGIDALFLLARHRENDAPLVAQATWALANLTWNRENQYRIARYLDALHAICTFRPAATSLSSADSNQQDEHDDMEWREQIREHGLCILANMLFYNDANRHLVASQLRWMSLLEHHCLHSRGALLEHAARALCALSYSDDVALAMGCGGSTGAPRVRYDPSLAAAAALNGLALFVRLCTRTDAPLVQRHGLYGIINMCLHDANKSRMLEVPQGIETLVTLSGQTDTNLCDPAIEALELLADVREQAQQPGVLGTGPAAVLSATTMSALASNDLKKLIALLNESGDPGLVALASDAIADEVWKKPSSKVRLRNEHGLEKLLELCVSPTSPIAADASHERVLVSCLWALRNSITDNTRNQDYVGALDGIPSLVGLYGRQHRRDDVVEAILAVLIALVMKHPRNAQQLVATGLDMLIPLADRRDVQGEDTEETRRETGSQRPRGDCVSPKKWDPSENPASRDDTQHQQHRIGNAALARELLLLLAPYNEVTELPVLSASRARGGQMSPEKRRTKRDSSVTLPYLAAGNNSRAPVASPTRRQQRT
ncbi:hypothetical protein PINS_up014493 [Pythium insidiosum]|nr:hypothetical protein PINS_up014493 [Pythium insidiosum]